MISIVSGDKKRIFDGNRLSLLAVELFFLNSLVKYFVPGFVTKTLPLLAVAFLIIQNKRQAMTVRKVFSSYWVFGIVYACGVLWSSDPIKGLMHAFSFFMALFFVNLASTEKIEWDKVFLYLAVTLLIITSFVFIQMTTPTITSTITRKLYSNTDNYYISAWLKNGWHTGIFPDRAPAAFFASMLCGVGGFYIFGQKTNKLFGFVLYTLGLGAILLTAKRGLLLGVLFASIVCYLIIRKAKGNSIFKIVIGLLVLLYVGGIIVLNLDIAQITLERFFNNEDLFTHRLEIYNNIFEQINQSFVFGTGTASAYSILGVGGHNIYLTVLMENGFIGFICLLVAFGGYLIRSIKELLKMGSSPYVAVAGVSVFIQIVFLTYGMSGNPLYDNYILFFYFGGVLIMENVKLIAKQKEKRN